MLEKHKRSLSKKNRDISFKPVKTEITEETIQETQTLNLDINTSKRPKKKRERRNIEYGNEKTEVIEEVREEETQNQVEIDQKLLKKTSKRKRKNFAFLPDFVNDVIDNFTEEKVETINKVEVEDYKPEKRKRLNLEYKEKEEVEE